MFGFEHLNILCFVTAFMTAVCSWVHPWLSFYGSARYLFSKFNKVQDLQAFLYIGLGEISLRTFNLSTSLLFYDLVSPQRMQSQLLVLSQPVVPKPSGVLEVAHTGL